MNKFKNLPEITINLGRINQYIVLLIVVVIALFVGKTNYTDVYDRINKLPEDKNELSPIKDIVVSIGSDSVLFVHVSFDAIVQNTIDNFYNNINARVIFDHKTTVVYAKDSNSKVFDPNYLEFTYKLNFSGKNISAQLFLFDAPINKIQFFDTSNEKELK